jgi:hypothetical protein
MSYFVDQAELAPTLPASVKRVVAGNATPNDQRIPNDGLLDMRPDVEVGLRTVDRNLSAGVKRMRKTMRAGSLRPD